MAYQSVRQEPSCSVSLSITPRQSIPTQQRGIHTASHRSKPMERPANHEQSPALPGWRVPTNVPQVSGNATRAPVFVGGCSNFLQVSDLQRRSSVGPRSSRWRRREARSTPIPSPPRGALSISWQSAQNMLTLSQDLLEWGDIQPPTCSCERKPQIGHPIWQSEPIIVLDWSRPRADPGNRCTGTVLHCTLSSAHRCVLPGEVLDKEDCHDTGRDPPL